MGKLILHLPDGATRAIPLERERTTIGRRVDNDVCLPFPAVSGAHATVVTVLDDSFLEDLNSTNGTLVNGKAITKHFLRDNDEIDIGRHKLVYVSGDYSGSAAAPVEPVGAAFEARFTGSTPPVDLDATLPPRLLPTSAAPTNAAFGGFPAMPASGAEVDTGPGVAQVSLPPAIEPDPDATPALAPTLEVLDGPNAGRVVAVGRDAFVIGRLGIQVVAVLRTPDGYRLVQLEGDTAPRINGASLPGEGSLLALGDEIEVAGTRLQYRPA